ncbi:MAG TPA: tryptophan synthase subunit beta, partial [Draconibacterium sp.]|nr:tryptophan synthase subunit beta [Draconibacterium sp.]
MKYQVDEKGYYGEFGGAWIPEMMFTNIDELKRRYLEIIESDSYKKEFDQLLKDYVGRPSP